MTCVPTGHFPPPTTPEELGARILTQERYDKFGESEEVEMEVESEDEEDDEREERDDGRPTQPDQDTQLQDMDEVSRHRPVSVYTHNSRMSLTAYSSLTELLIEHECNITIIRK